MPGCADRGAARPPYAPRRLRERRAIRWNRECLPPRNFAREIRVSAGARESLRWPAFRAPNGAEFAKYSAVRRGVLRGFSRPAGGVRRPAFPAIPEWRALSATKVRIPALTKYYELQVGKPGLEYWC